MYDEYGDGWNGGTFAVRNWITDEYEFGPVTLEDGFSELLKLASQKIWHTDVILLK